MFRINEIINSKLYEIQEKENVRILHCVESGSRAWGFPSPDSDYDVRFIYVRPKEFYLKLDKTRDVIEWQLDDTLDINGWDLRKMLTLLHGSNPTVFEWNNSPIVYKTTDEWESISTVINSYFNVKSVLYHYLHMAKRTYHDFLRGDSVKLKKYFYVLRPILACNHIIKNQTAPPMLFSELLCYLDDDIRSEVDKLMETKKETSELGTSERIHSIHSFIENEMPRIEAYVDSIPSSKNYDWESLDKVFLDSLL